MKTIRLIFLIATMLSALPLWAENRETLGEAWWTGSMLSSSPTPMPAGHLNLEPTLLEENGFKSATLIDAVFYGVTDRFTLALMPTAGWSRQTAGAGDLPVLLIYGLNKFTEQDQTPTVSLVLKQVFPTGDYDKFGGGAYKTGGGIFAQTYSWMPNGRLLRSRINLIATHATAADIDGVSVYGTGQGFHGKAKSGNSVDADLSFEYSATQEWVLVAEADYGVDAAARITGIENALPVARSLGSSRPQTFAPGIEYNFNQDVGVIFAVRIVTAGRNVAPSTMPALAINLFF